MKHNKVYETQKKLVRYFVTVDLESPLALLEYLDISVFYQSTGLTAIDHIYSYTTAKPIGDVAVVCKGV